MRRLILRSFQSPGDIVVLTAAVRDLHKAHPGQFQTDVRTSADALWEHNPYITPLREGDAGVDVLEMHYPLIHSSNQRPYHFLHGYVQYLEEQLDVRIPLTEFRGDIHLSEQEEAAPPLASLPDDYWILVGGGKYDFTAKWWNPDSFQALVEHFQGRIAFVQCGEEGHWHPRVQGAVDLVGKTTPRQFIQLMHHAEGVVCPVTFAMHLAAAVKTRDGRPPIRPCVVIAGGREPAHWEAYPNHQFISNNGALPCCQRGGCWKSRCQTVGDGDLKDRRELCELPVNVREDLQIPKCMEMIQPDDVIRRIDWFREGGATLLPRKSEVAVPHTKRAAARSSFVRSRWSLESNQGSPASSSPQVQRTTMKTAADVDQPAPAALQTAVTDVLIKFSHGLGDAVQLRTVLRHLQKHRPDWRVSVAALTGKHSAFRELCHESLDMQRDRLDEAAYDRVFDLAWHECHACFQEHPSTKVEQCLRDVFQLEPDMALYGEPMAVSAEKAAQASAYLDSICQPGPNGDGRYPVVLIHYEGNTSAEHKNLSTGAVSELCETVIQHGFTPVILDWDGRSPLPDGRRIHNPSVNCELWGRTGTGDAEGLAALIARSTLMIGVDSGPLHTAFATSTPTIAVWTGHHPVHYAPPLEHVFHLVPKNHASMLRGKKCAGTEFFEKQYRYAEYQDVRDSLTPLAVTYLSDDQSELMPHHGFWIRRDNAEQDMVIVRDIFEGDAYRTAELPPRADEEVVFDIGSHIGCFAKKWRAKNPNARIVCVEACPENLPALRENVGSFAEVVHAACTYEPGPMALLNAVRPNCESTGGSVVVPRSQLESTDQRQQGYVYWNDLRELPTVTLEELLARFGLDRIDVLKLDCEGSEYSILGKTPSLNRIGVIVGEYHDRARWEAFRPTVFGDWEYAHLHDGGENGGLFRYRQASADKRPSLRTDNGSDELAENSELPGRARNAINSPLLQVAVPAGIGDSIWSLTKIPDMLKRYKLEKAHIALCGGPPYRARDFISRFDFVESVEYSDYVCVEQPHCTDEGVYNWAPSQPNWHFEFDWMLQANRHLENGRRLDEWMPEFETDWRIADRFSFTGGEVRQARDLERELGPYCVFYLGPETGNTSLGHNRGPLWRPQDWEQLAQRVRKLGLAVVVTGAEYDRSYYENHLAGRLGRCHDAIGRWGIGETLAVIQRSRFLVAYQSGLGVFAVYLGVPTAMFWRPFGDSIDPNALVTFDERMASAWSPPGAVQSGRHLPVIYTKCSPESIAEHAADHQWHTQG
ncbi:MAG: FkbM family methyltransferase [Pirellulaceae bacterium]|jgi:FkbM family methyltransferase|nr:FkbM family methyltransferase [Pirellulaceae bacterium]